MHAGKLVFAPLLEFAPWHTFRRLAVKYQGNFNVRRFSCLDQFLCMAFAQLTYRESLRDIEACLRAQPEKLYHMGIRGRVSRSALADANESRDWRIYYEFAQPLIAMARELYAEESLGGIRPRLDHDRFVLVDVRVGIVPPCRGRRQTSYAAPLSLHTMLQILGVRPFENQSLLQLLKDAAALDSNTTSANQLNLL
jgi:hypothetical protein